MYVIVTLIAIMVSIIAGILAHKKDKNVVRWTLIAFFFTILILILLFQKEELILPFFNIQK